MISVQSLLQRLNGNKFTFILIGALLFALSSCDLLKPLPKDKDRDKEKEEELDPIGGGRIYNPETGEFEKSDEVVLETMDTIRWREISAREYPPITTEGLATENSDGGRGQVLEEGEFGTQLLSSYNVSMMLPFLTDRFDGSESNLDLQSRWAVQFYTGAKIAIEQLDQERTNLKVSVYDTKADERILNEVLQRDTGFIASSHLVMGTVKGECVARMAQYAKAQQVPFVSPFSANTKITKENPYYIQINPSIATHLKAITRHARSNYNSDQIVVVAKRGDQSEAIMNYIQELNYEIAGSNYAPRFEELVIQDDSPTMENTNLDVVMRSGRTTVFILPIMRDREGKDKDFIYAFLRKAYLASRSNGNSVVIYGMRHWQYYDDADPNYFENLNVHISSEYYVDKYSEVVRDFRRRYYDLYGTVPSAEAFRGFDNMLYFGRMLKKHGTKFYEFFNREVENALHTTYNLEPITPIVENNYGQEIYGTPDRFENQYVHILKFEDYYFQ
ncbi:MAG: ABC transporter substrate-binding protein, partial [Bacteroidota bacterium]